MQPDDDEAFAQRLSTYAQSKLDAVMAEVDKATRDGTDIADLVGLISDGKGKMASAGERAIVVPRSHALLLVPVARQVPQFAQPVAELERPKPGSFLIIIIFEDETAFTSFHYETITVSRQPAFKMTRQPIQTQRRIIGAYGVKEGEGRCESERVS